MCDLEQIAYYYYTLNSYLVNEDVIRLLSFLSSPF